MSSIFFAIFTRIKLGESPIPALRTQMDEKYRPQRINDFLRFVHKIWQAEIKNAQIKKDKNIELSLSY